MNMNESIEERHVKCPECSKDIDIEINPYSWCKKCDKYFCCSIFRPCILNYHKRFNLKEGHAFIGILSPSRKINLKKSPLRTTKMANDNVIINAPIDFHCSYEKCPDPKREGYHYTNGDKIWFLEIEPNKSMHIECYIKKCCDCKEQKLSDEIIKMWM